MSRISRTSDGSAHAELGESQGRRTTVTVAELLGHQPGPTANRHRSIPAAPTPGLVHRLAHGARRHKLRTLLGGLALLIAAGLAALGISVQEPEQRLGAGDDDVAAAQAGQWLQAYAPGPVLTDGGMRGALLYAGWSPARVATPDSCSSDACPPAWLVVTPALRADLSLGGPLASAVNESTPVAVFGSDGGRIEIRHPHLRTPEQAAAEGRARTIAGQALTGLSRVTASPEVRALLDAGRADPRVIGMLATLAVSGTVQVPDLPPVPGEDAAGQPRRQMLLAVPEYGPGTLKEFFAAQDPPYRPAAVDDGPTGLLVRYPPLAPPNLLETFDGP